MALKTWKINIRNDWVIYSDEMRKINQKINKKNGDNIFIINDSYDIYFKTNLKLS